MRARAHSPQKGHLQEREEGGARGGLEREHARDGLVHGRAVGGGRGRELAAQNAAHE